eukprot:3427068-Pleurochrysis_carterae.AAC.1
MHAVDCNRARRRRARAPAVSCNRVWGAVRRSRRAAAGRAASHGIGPGGRTAHAGISLGGGTRLDAAARRARGE